MIYIVIRHDTEVAKAKLNAKHWGQNLDSFSWYRKSRIIS